jgi:ABC-type Na+ efflux pump permease subunit
MSEPHASSMSRNSAILEQNPVYLEQEQRADPIEVEHQVRSKQKDRKPEKTREPIVIHSLLSGFLLFYLSAFLPFCFDLFLP